MPLFEVAIYNSAVRQIVEEGGHHAEYKDDWADSTTLSIKPWMRTTRESGASCDTRRIRDL